MSSSSVRNDMLPMVVGAIVQGVRSRLAAFSFCLLQGLFAANGLLVDIEASCLSARVSSEAVSKLISLSYVAGFEFPGTTWCTLSHFCSEPNGTLLSESGRGIWNGIWNKLGSEELEWSGFE